MNLAMPVIPDPYKFTLKNEEACKRHSGLVIDNIKVSESPDWLKNRFKAIGLRPANNIVDITNFVLHELGNLYTPLMPKKLKEIRSL